ncbi:hypothetical protein [Aquabacterium sp.]|uniref:hypothetical protein n=1 Tax=Aquabacterium sp. TaxID=1872578 RepID=UPI002E35AE1C|nr:hypothetical protein [Aquabacterium sp.]HEX5312215.1 hypothetical protein [Aquabacterium sp.]
MTSIKAKAACLLGSGLLANGSAMLIAPELWFRHVPTVSLTGPLNAHLVRDVGSAYLVSGLAFMQASLKPQIGLRTMAWPSAFLVLHALIHLYEVATNMCGWQTWLESAPGVTAPALLAAWITWSKTNDSALGGHSATQRQGA